MKQQEIWKDIEGFEGIYQVSTFGRVKSLERNGGGNNSTIKERILKPADNKGYLRVSLYKHRKPNNWKLIHRLVALAFIPNPKNKRQVNHKNFCKSDNTIENLEWATKQEDAAHLARSGKVAGENHSKSKLTWEKVKEIRNKYLSDNKTSNSTLAKKYSIGKPTIRQIIHNKIWKDKEYQNIVNSEQFKVRLENATNKGEFNRSAKLTEKQVLEIRQSNKNGESTQSLSERFRISHNHTNLIIRKKTWKHI